MNLNNYIQNHLINYISHELYLTPDEIDITQNIRDYGANSITILQMLRDIEDRFGIKITGREMMELKTIGSISTYLANKIALSDHPQNIPNQKRPLETKNSSPNGNLSLKNPLSEGQKGLWALQKTAPNMSAYNVPLCFRVGRELDLAKFQQACRFLLEQYPILNTVIGEEQGVPYQIIQPKESLFFETEDISTYNPEDVIPYLRKKLKIPFQLEQGPLMRVHLFTRSNEEGKQIVLINIHHIIFDGISSSLLITKLIDIYQTLLQEKIPEIIPSATNYGDFVEWEQVMLASEAGEEHLAYWKQQLSGTLPVLELPTDHPRSSVPSFEGQVLTKLLSTELADQIKAFADSLHINRSVMFLGIFKVLLHRYTNQEDLIIGLPTFGRPEERFNPVVGYFINMIPIRSQVIGSKSFSDYAKGLQLTFVDGLDHAAYPFPALVRALNVPRIPGNSPVFQVVFLYQNFIQAHIPPHFQGDGSNRLIFEFTPEINQEGEYELELEVFEQSDTFRLNFKHNPRLFEEETIARMMEHYLNLTAEVMKAPDISMDSYSFLSPAEIQKLLIDWNATQIDYPREKCVHELFEEQVQKNPDAVAVVFEDETLTYRELDTKSSQLALFLQKQGVGPDCLVGICVERHWEMIVGLLGILKAGGAYIPLDPEYPADRLEYMLENSKVSLLLTQARLMPKISHLLKDNRARARAKVVALDKDWAEIQAETGTLRRKVHSGHLAYVIYTSGSTGRPKGVMVPHRALTNFLISMSKKPGLSSRDKLLAVTTFCFDIAGLELYLPLINGAQVYICSSETAKDVEKLKQEIRKYHPTIMQATPVTWTMLFLTGWRNEERIKILCGGEALSENLKQSFMDNQCELWNMFGPTETTIWSTIEPITQEEPVTLGKPIANTRIYIVDRNFKLVPTGIPGELCIAGDGLAKGYLNQPELTAEKFVPNPFTMNMVDTEQCSVSTERMYRTGDLARWTTDGKIEFLGRLDHQVKIRGFRIELGEIERQLLAHPEIQDCAVIVKEKADHKQLLGFYIAQKPLSQKQLRDFLSPKLPEYMIPASFIALDNMPLTPNGKHDRKALSNHPVIIQKLETKEAEPHFAIEAKVLGIWKDVLHRNEIGLAEGFFDVGGDSFLAVTVAGRIKEKLNCDFSVTELFQYANIRAISQYISKKRKVVFSSPPDSMEPKRRGEQKMPNIEASYHPSCPDYYQDSIAIIGISCQFPGARNYPEFWNNLRAGKESVKFFSKEELLSLKLPKEMIEDPNFVPVQATIEDRDLFDPGFFNISPRDVEYMDPQFRLLLLHSWKAVEDAGYIPGQIPETGVFMTAGNNLYTAMLSNFKQSSSQIDDSERYVAWLLGQGGTIPTMISHKLGFVGPSFFVHSNCSSSLVGINSAVQSLRTGESKYALVGAASISCLFDIGYSYEKGLNFSSDGHLKAFDASADGMIDGEGVAVIVLKKAIDAVCDGDNIYAILRGIGINNDGADKVGFYAPSVKGQAAVIRKVLDGVQIHPESISYVEAHGTGTKLGDPIEFAALTETYRQYTTKKGYCGIGSVKTNIGHLDTAAGLAGCIKVALSLYYSEVPPSLNYKEPNPDIDIKNSPFYVVDKLLKLDEDKTPHRVALSSFGIGGTNTHAIFEQYVSIREPVSNQDSYVIPLSARNEERLKVYARELVSFLNINQVQSKFDLNRLAYTLQVGREAMEARLAFVVCNTGELIQKLEAFLGGNEKSSNCFIGKMHQPQAQVRLLEKEEDFKEIIHKWYQKGLLGKIAEFWAGGFQIDWEILYPEPKPRRCSLPTYPFARERYELPSMQAYHDMHQSPGGANNFVRATGQSPLPIIHPLLQHNTSDLSEQRYSSTFTGREFFLTDHVVNGQKVLPGVAYLEMARAAIEASWPLAMFGPAAMSGPAAMTMAAGNLTEGRQALKLNNVVWAQPIIVDGEPVQLHIGLYPEDSAFGEVGFNEAAVAYEIYSLAENGTAELLRVDTRTVYSQGSARLTKVMENPVLDLKALQAECNGWRLSGTEIYSIYHACGFDYGPGLQGIETVYTGPGRVLAKLALPPSIAGTEAEFVLHPSIMDAALQASIALEAGEHRNMAAPKLSASLKPTLPFALQELEIYCAHAQCAHARWANIQYSKDNTASDKVEKLDIDILDEHGNVCVRLKGYTSRVLEGGIARADETGSAANIGSLHACVLLEPVWKEQAVLKSDSPNINENIQQLVILCEPGGISPRSIEKGLSGAGVLSLQSKEKSIAKRFENYTVQLFEMIREILTDKTTGKVLIQLVFASISELNGQAEQQVFAGLSGILKTAGLENPKVIGQIIEVETMDDPERLTAKLTENAHQLMDSQIRYQGGKRHVAVWSEIARARATVPPEAAGIPWKDEGVYLITGGTGGLGMIFAKEIAARTKDVTLVLTGRSPLGAEKQAQLRDFQSAGARIEYRSVDVSDGKAAHELIRSIQADFGKLDGIIHCAGVIRDNYIIKKSKEELVEVLAPKVTGLINLDEASRDLNLDFMILFSSTSGSMGNPGQADYAAANAFMDAYAGYRNALVSSGRRRGRTLSINWPLWQEGGMRVDETVETMMRQSEGIVTLRTETGIRALYEGFASGRTQVCVLEGDIRQIRAMYLSQVAFQKESEIKTQPAIASFGGAKTQFAPIQDPFEGKLVLKEPVPARSMNPGASRKQESGTVADQELLLESTSNYLKKLLSPVIKLPAERVEADTPMEKYGIDSIMVMKLTNQLEKTFGSLSKTLFFEYQTIRELSGYFLQSYRERLNQLIGIETKEELTRDTGTATTPGPKMPVIPIIHNQNAGRPRRSRFTTPLPVQESNPNRAPEIAIIGLSGRYPEARNVREFWKNLRDGKDCITEIPKDRWDHRLYFDEDKNKPGKTYSKWGGFIDGVDQFDPLFFNISPLEAELMDPQERLFLECVYETLEDAGYTRQSIGEASRQGSEQGSETEGNVGVYVGVMYDEYQLYAAQAQVQGFPVAISGNPSDIANRVSYFCNFHGPSMAVDTMCSASLTAIHLACQSLRQGNCELAIAGGVNVSVHPNKYLVLGQARFVSSIGRCESFGKGGDGYVPGEGVGAVLLKPLSNAIADGDHIYGVIKGTAINHDGKTNGYTVPNPNAQARVIGQALKEAGINPRTISYIEAHGTGTSLGDPIEITGLVKAFQKITGDKQFCAIGSAKSNIGHCESAAGIAGVTKVLLQMKNRQIAPSLHSEVLNPNIDFLNTPFIVQQKLTAWERPVVTIDGVTREYPRIAGISSFGAGGSNAHIIIEEYNPVAVSACAHTTPQQPALIILSARDEERLKEQAERLVAAIRECQLSDADLADMAYTLQTGREAMEERLGVISVSVGELTEKLTVFLAGQNGIEDLYRGQVKRNQEALSVFTADEEMQEAIQKWIERKKYGKLLDLWAKGLIFDWNKLYGGQKPRRISLPTYPFARDRYWVPASAQAPIRATGRSPQPALHPLLQQNISDFSEQRYSSTFTGHEFFLADHVVNGQKVLPGVAYLEMARAAVEGAATRGLAMDRMMIKLKNVVWVRPLWVGEQPAQLHIGLYLENNDEINYEIYDATGTEDEMPLVYSQGRAILTSAPELPVLDLKAVQAECGEKILQATEVYETYRRMGIEYGPGHRGIEEIHIGPEQVLARILLPSTITETQEQFVLHPSIMDAALQASIVLETSRAASKGTPPMDTPKPTLPFALEELEIIGRCASRMWALIRHSEGSNIGDKVRKLDIDLCDDRGRICARLKGFSSRVLEREIPIAAGTRSVPVDNLLEFQAGTIMLTPAWETVSVKRVEAFPALSDRIVIIGGTKAQKSNIQKQYPDAAVLELQTSDSIDEITRKLTEYGTINHILWIAPYRKIKSLADENLIKEQNQGVLHVFKIIKALLKSGYGTRELAFSLITNRTQVVHKNDEVNPTHASLSGLAGSMAKEYSNWNIRLVDLETEVWPEISDIFTLPPDPEGNALAFRGGEWYQQQLVPVRSIPVQETKYKTGGVYVVIGGAGGIGETLSEYMIRTYQAQVIWIGRRAKDEAIQAKIERLAGFGPEPRYIAADATKREALEEAYQSIKQSHSQINGVVHSAIVLSDRSLANMTEEQFQAALSAKVDVSVRMAQVFSKEPLDFVMFFSSMESFSKSAGQSNYASGCTFKDAFAHRMNKEWPGIAKVMNWGYWGNVGIVASKVYQERMAQAGIGSIEPPEAMDALERLLAGPLDQIAFMKTIKPLTIEGTNPEKQITIYPEKLPSVIGKIEIEV